MPSYNILGTAHVKSNSTKVQIWKLPTGINIRENGVLAPLGNKRGMEFFIATDVDQTRLVKAATGTLLSQILSREIFDPISVEPEQLKELIEQLSMKRFFFKIEPKDKLDLLEKENEDLKRQVIVLQERLNEILRVEREREIVLQEKLNEVLQVEREREKEKQEQDSPPETKQESEEEKEQEPEANQGVENTPAAS